MFLGIDIGGTNVRVSAFANLENHDRIGGDEFRATRDYGRDLESLMGICTRLNYSFASQYRTIEGIGIAIAGVVNKQRTLLVRAGNTAHWVNQPFIRHLGLFFECPTALGNDAEAAAMAEAIYGNPGGQDFWFVIWGTGIGGTLVRYIGGKPHAFAGEMGHMRLDDTDEYQCECGQFGCLETLCGGAMIHEYRGKPANELDVEEWDWVVSDMAAGLRLVATCQPVRRIYLSGGIAAKQAYHIIPNLQARLRANQGLVEMPDIQLSMFGESAGTVGSLALLKSALE